MIPGRLIQMSRSRMKTDTTPPQRGLLRYGIHTGRQRPQDQAICAPMKPCHPSFVLAIRTTRTMISRDRYSMGDLQICHRRIETLRTQTSTNSTHHPSPTTTSVAQTRSALVAAVLQNPVRSRRAPTLFSHANLSTTATPQSLAIARTSPERRDHARKPRRRNPATDHRLTSARAPRSIASSHRRRARGRHSTCRAPH